MVLCVDPSGEPWRTSKRTRRPLASRSATTPPGRTLRSRGATGSSVGNSAVGTEMRLLRTSSSGNSGTLNRALFTSSARGCSKATLLPVCSCTVAGQETTTEPLAPPPLAKGLRSFFAASLTISSSTFSLAAWSASLKRSARVNRWPAGPDAMRASATSRDVAAALEPPYIVPMKDQGWARADSAILSSIILRVSSSSSATMPCLVTPWTSCSTSVQVSSHRVGSVMTVSVVIFTPSLTESYEWKLQGTAFMHQRVCSRSRTTSTTSRSQSHGRRSSEARAATRGDFAAQQICMPCSSSLAATETFSSELHPRASGKEISLPAPTSTKSCSTVGR
mmetsp:Transcript_33282/g.103758  ORF Transcript_33282/g.103758 Transcript_33282/m.103758 type:complete len:335 (+) Transcript_33282:1562-2566(+)